MLLLFLSLNPLPLSHPASLPCPALVVLSLHQERGHKQLGQGSAAAHLALIVSLVGLSYLWLYLPTDTLYLCRAQNMGTGLVYALFASQLIMAHMCKEPFQPTSALVGMALMAGGVLNNVLGWADPLQVTLGIDALLLLIYLHYVVGVINQICAHLGINCLTIKPKAAAA